MSDIKYGSKRREGPGDLADTGGGVSLTKPRKEPQTARVTAQRQHAPCAPLLPPTTSTRSSHPGFVVLLAAFSTLFSALAASFLLSNRVSSSWSSLSSSASMLAKRTCFFLLAVSRAADEDIPVNVVVTLGLMAVTVRCQSAVIGL